jgi:hypothetical protein
MAELPSTPPQPAQSALTKAIFARLTEMMGGPQTPATLNAMLRLLGKWRASEIVAQITRRDGFVIKHGPFRGMLYNTSASEGSAASRLLGVYEASLAPIVEDIAARGYATVMDVGCAEGYYAVGLALRLPNAKILAHDTNPAARSRCAALGAQNGVGARIAIGGEVGHADFDICHAAPTLVVCDIEGGEDHLLNPAHATGLIAADILVEVHDCFTPNLSAKLAQRFVASHDVQIIHRSLDSAGLPDWMHGYSDMDRLIALWEWRAGPTPWLWMRSKTLSKLQDKT